MSTSGELPPVHDLPPMEPPVLVVGDVHLGPRSPEVTEAFLAFLDGLVGRVRHLVLLGDLFDAWVGDDQREEPTVARVLAALGRVVASGTRVAFQAGNRDFLFRAGPGLDVDHWPDVVRTRWGERTVVLTHGDLLCTADVGYQRLRRVVRSRGFGRAARLTPRWVRRSVGKALRGASKRTTHRAPRGVLGLDYAEARRWLEGLGAQLLVAGHVHTGVHHRLLAAGGGEVIVLRDWDRGGNAIRYDERGTQLVALEAGRPVDIAVGGGARSEG